MDAATQRLLRRSQLLAGLRRDVLARLVGKAEVRELPRRAPIWSPGDLPAGLGMVRSGVLREGVGDGDDELLLRFPSRGEWVGDAATLTGAPHHTRLEAHEEAVLLWIPAAALEPLDGVLARRLAQGVGERARLLELRLVEAARHTVEQRVAGAVLDLAGAHGVRDSRGVIVNLRLTRRDLAALAGSTRESTSTVVSRWEHQGLVETEARRLVVLDADRLRRLAGRAPEPEGSERR